MARESIVADASVVVKWFVEEEYSEDDEETAKMKAWEKRLALREKELRKKFELREKKFDAKKEKKSNKDWKKHL